MALKPLQPRIALKLARIGEERVRPKIRSNQLRRGLYRKTDTENPNKQHLIVPHFWATFIHDGRDPVKGDPLLIWFRNPKDDPRLNNGRTPERLTQTRRMTKAQVKEWTGINRKIIQQYRKSSGKKVLTPSDYAAMKLPMIVARMVPGTYKPSKVYPFFSNEAGGGMAGFSKVASDTAQKEVSDYVTGALSRAGLLNVKKTVTVRF